VISVFTRALLDNRAPIIYGDGEQTRDFTYIANVVDGVLRACTANVSGQVLNVATGSRISLNELFRVLRGLTGGEGVNPSYGSTRAGDVRDSQADISKARQLLGYEPLVGLEEGLRRTVDWYRTESATI
jgi:nucleoside-diphosphate-sugar epimerase